MRDYFLDFLTKRGIRIKETVKLNKKSATLIASILMLVVGLFFYSAAEPFFDEKAHAEKSVIEKAVSPEEIDPLNRIGKGVVLNIGPTKSCKAEEKTPDYLKKKEDNSPEEKKIGELVSGHPIEQMIPFIAKRERKVAAFLVAIAKKESDWGTHSPKKNGKECYNFWGYRGGENPTESGYSCFDSPEHAIQVVGDRIEKLIGQDINTPQRMVVWKCGGSCAATGGQAAADKWVADVAGYFNKLQS